MMEYKLKEFYKGLIKYMTQALEENLLLRVVLVAQLAEQSFPTQGSRDSKWAKLYALVSFYNRSKSNTWKRSN